jgi:hypothetical protein
VHGCDGCCGDPSFAKEFKQWRKKLDRAGIESQKRILKCMNFKSKSMQRRKK